MFFKNAFCVILIYATLNHFFNNLFWFSIGCARFNKHFLFTFHGNRINTAMLDGHVAALQMPKFAENYVKGISWKEMGITASAVIYSFNEQLALIPSTVK